MSALTHWKRKLAGTILFAIPCVFAITAPMFVTGSPNDQSLMDVLKMPSSEHWFGTDHYGRDMWLRLAAALKVSLSVALISTTIATFMGTFLGIISAQHPNKTDKVINFSANLFLAVPGLLFVLLLATIAPEQLWPVFLGVSLIASIEIYRVVRAQSMIIASRDAVSASKLLGFNTWYALRRHYFPELRPTVLRLGAFTLATTILSVAALGFISVGIKPPRAELGLMMTEMLPYYHEAPWIIIQPILALFMLVLGLNLMVMRSEKTPK